MFAVKLKIIDFAFINSLDPDQKTPILFELFEKYNVDSLERAVRVKNLCM